MMIKNERREEARQLIYQAIVIKGYKLKHLSTRYTDGVFVIIFSYTFKLNVLMVDQVFFMNIKLRRLTYLNKYTINL